MPKIILEMDPSVPGTGQRSFSSAGVMLRHDRQLPSFISTAYLVPISFFHQGRKPHRSQPHSSSLGHPEPGPPGVLGRRHFPGSPCSHRAASASFWSPELVSASEDLNC